MRFLLQETDGSGSEKLPNTSTILLFIIFLQLCNMNVVPAAMMPGHLQSASHRIVSKREVFLHTCILGVLF